MNGRRHIRFNLPRKKSSLKVEEGTGICEPIAAWREASPSRWATRWLGAIGAAGAVGGDLEKTAPAVFRNTATNFQGPLDRTGDGEAG